MPEPYDKIRVEKSGNLYNLIADGIARGTATPQQVAVLLGDQVDHANEAAFFEDIAARRLEQARTHEYPATVREALSSEALAAAQLATSHRMADATKRRSENTSAIERELERLVAIARDREVS